MVFRNEGIYTINCLRNLSKNQLLHHPKFDQTCHNLSNFHMILSLFCLNRMVGNSCHEYSRGGQIVQDQMVGFVIKTSSKVYKSFLVRRRQVSPWA